MNKKRVKELAGISDTKLVSAFPGCGKSYFFKNNKELNTLDSDSSGFDKRNFPDNYTVLFPSTIELFQDFDDHGVCSSCELLQKLS